PWIQEKSPLVLLLPWAGVRTVWVSCYSIWFDPSLKRIEPNRTHQFNQSFTTFKSFNPSSRTISFFTWVSLSCFEVYSPSSNASSGAMTRATTDISLRRIFSEGPEVSLKGSPTVSPTTAALWGSDFL